MFKKKLLKSGNSYCVTLSPTLLALAGIPKGGLVSITFENGKIVIGPTKETK